MCSAAQDPGLSHDPQKGGRRARKALATRRALFEAALDAFDRESPAEVAVFEITEAADVAKGVFYLQFRSKVEFLLALLEDVRTRFLEQAADHLAGARTLRSRVGRLVEQYHRFAAAHRREARFLIHLQTYFGDDELNRRQIPIEDVHFQRLATLLAGDELSDGTIDLAKTARIAELTRIVDTLCWGLIALAWRRNESIPDRDAMKRTVIGAIGWRLAPPGL